MSPIKKLLWSTILSMLSFFIGQELWAQGFELSGGYETKKQLLAKLKISFVEHPKAEFQNGAIRIYDPVTNQTLFTAPVSNLPDPVNSALVSSDGKYFLAFEETEEPTKTVFFFSITGQLLRKYDVNIYPAITESVDKNMYQMFDLFGKELLVFTKTGKLIFSEDYQKLLGTGQYPLDGFFYNGNTGEAYINANSALAAFTGKQLNWQRDSRRVRKMYSINGQLLVQSLENSGKKSPTYTLASISSDGQVIQSITGITSIEEVGNQIIIQKDNSYYGVYISK